MNKMRYIEKKFKEAKDFLRNTGEGLTLNDEKLGIRVIREKVLSICPFYFLVKPFMSESASINPPYIGGTTTDENVPEMLFGTSSARGLNNSTEEDVPDHSDAENSNNDEYRDFEDEILEQSEPLPQPTSEDIPIATRPEPTQSQTIPNAKAKERKKKPKSFQELVQDIQEQNRILMEKTLNMQVSHQSEKLLFLEEESKDKLSFMRDELTQKFALESRRLDLEFLRLEQQCQDSHNQGLVLQVQLDQQRQDGRNRELALQLELEKLRCNS